MKPEEIDQFFNQKLSELDDVMPPTDWNPEATFYTIQNKMKPTRRLKFLPAWYMSKSTLAMAASVSLIALITGAVYFDFVSSSETSSSIADFIEDKTEKSLDVQQLMTDSWIDEENTPEIKPYQEVEGSSNILVVKNSNKKAYSIIPDDMLEEIIQAQNAIELVKLPSVDVQAPETVASKLIKKEGKSFDLSHPFKKDVNTTEISDNALQMNLMAGVGYVANKVAPVVQLETRLLTTNQNQSSKWNTYGGGLSVEGFISKSEQGVEVRPHVFAEVSTGKLSKNEDKAIKGRGWSMGYLLNPQEGTNMGRDTFRVRYTWELKNKIRISPELLVSDGFQRVYPGIRITKG